MSDIQWPADITPEPIKMIPRDEAPMQAPDRHVAPPQVANVLVGVLGFDLSLVSDERQTPAINAAVSRVMAEQGYIQKLGHNKFHDYDYATADDIRDQVGKSLARHGLSFLQHEVGIQVVDKIVFVTYYFRLLHASGEVGHLERVTVAVTMVSLKGAIDDKCIAKARVGALKDWCKSRFMVPAGDGLDSDDDRGNQDTPDPTLLDRVTAVLDLLSQQKTLNDVRACQRRAIQLYQDSASNPEARKRLTDGFEAAFRAFGAAETSPPAAETSPPAVLPSFAAKLRDPYGHEIATPAGTAVFSDPFEWSEAFCEMYAAAGSADETNGLRHHNADALIAAAGFPRSRALLDEMLLPEEVEGAGKPTAISAEKPSDDGAWDTAVDEPIVAVPVPEDTRRGNAWETYRKSIMGSFGTWVRTPRWDVWIEAQRETIISCPRPQLLAICAGIIKLCAEHGGDRQPPEWVVKAVAGPEPEPKRDTDREIVGRLLAHMRSLRTREEIHALEGSVAVTALFARLKDQRRELCDELRSAFTARMGRDA